MSRYDDWGTYLDPDLEGADPPDQPRAALDGVKNILSDASTWADPPPELRDRLMTEAAAVHSGTPNVVPITAAKSARSRIRPTAWVAGLAAVAVLAIVVAIALPRDTASTFDLAGTALTPNATATAEVVPLQAGVAITLNIAGLPPAGDGEYYAAWLRGEPGMVGIGSFHWREGGIPIELWSGVDTARYPMLMVTLQQEGLPPTPSTEVVLTGRVDR